MGKKDSLKVFLAACLGFLICNADLSPTLADELVNEVESSQEQQFIYYFQEPQTTIESAFIPETPIHAQSYFADSYSFGYQIQSNVVAYEVYNAMRTNIELLKTGTAAIPISVSIPSGYSKAQVGRDLQTGMDAFDRDYSEVFWLDVKKLSLSYRIGGGRLEGQFIPVHGNYFSNDYTSQAEVEQDIHSVEGVINQLTFSAVGSDYEKLRYFHDYIVDRTDYNEKLFTNQASPKAWEITSALFYGNTDKNNADNPVCEGYARSLKVLCDRVGIPNMLVSGIGKGGAHMWNYVRLDGVWYAVDATWDDPVYGYSPSEAQKKENQYKYFMRGSKNFPDHLNDGRVVTGGYRFTYPILSDTDYVPGSEQPEVMVADGTIYKGTMKLGTGYEIFQAKGLDGLIEVITQADQHLYVVQNKCYPLNDVDQVFESYEHLSKTEVYEKIVTELASKAQKIPS